MSLCFFNARESSFKLSEGMERESVGMVIELSGLANESVLAGNVPGGALTAPSTCPKEA